MVKINGEALEVTVDAPGAALGEAAETALTLHRRVCAGMRAAERAEERRQGAPVVKVGSAHFGFAVPDHDDSEVEE